VNKQIAFRFALGVALVGGCAAVGAKPPTCAQPVGRWNDEIKSVIEIKTYDPASGAISGQYVSRSGAGSWPMVGWINSAPATPGMAGKGNHADVFTLQVRWTDTSSVTAWTGTCTVNSKSGLAQISTLWHTTRPNADFEWAHTITGSEVFLPIE
jgi:hypothetical protein